MDPDRPRSTGRDRRAGPGAGQTECPRRRGLSLGGRARRDPTPIVHGHHGAQPRAGRARGNRRRRAGGRVVGLPSCRRSSAGRPESRFRLRCPAPHRRRARRCRRAAVVECLAGGEGVNGSVVARPRSNDPTLERGAVAERLGCTSHCAHRGPQRARAWPGAQCGPVGLRAGWRRAGGHRSVRNGGIRGESDLPDGHAIAIWSGFRRLVQSQRDRPDLAERSPARLPRAAGRHRDHCWCERCRPHQRESRRRPGGAKCSGPICDPHHLWTPSRFRRRGGPRRKNDARSRCATRRHRRRGAPDDWRRYRTGQAVPGGRDRRLSA